MPSTPTTRFGFVTEADGDALVSAAGRLRTLATAIDSAITGFLSGTAASRPGAAVAGRLYLATDIAGEIAMDTGSAWVSVSPGYGASLPTTGLYDGQQFIYTADGTNGVRWELRYNASGGTYKWEFVGGSPLTNEVPDNDTVSLATGYVDPAHVGPSITVPLAGEYLISYGVAVTTASNGQMRVGLKIGAAAPTDEVSIRAAATTGSTSADGRAAHEPFRRTITPAGTVIKLQYRQDTAGGGSVSNRNLTLTPARVA